MSSVPEPNWTGIFREIWFQRFLEDLCSRLLYTTRYKGQIGILPLIWTLSLFVTVISCQLSLFVIVISCAHKTIIHADISVTHAQQMIIHVHKIITHAHKILLIFTKSSQGLCRTLSISV